MGVQKASSELGRMLSRRSVLLGTGALGFGALAAACGSGGTAGSGSSAEGSSSNTASNASTSSASGSSESSSGSSAGTATHFKAGIAVPIFSFTTLMVAAAENFFAKENLTVDINIFKGDVSQMQAFIAKDLDIALGGVTESFTFAGQGVAAPVFYSLYDGLSYQFMAKPEIQTLADMKGKTFGVSSKGALTDQLARMVLGDNGLDPNMMVIQQSGGSSARWAALSSGAIDATLLDEPTVTLALDKGYKSLADLAKMFPTYPYEVALARKQDLIDNEDAYVRFAKALIAATAFTKDKANEDAVINVVSEKIGMKKDDVKIAYDKVLSYFPEVGTPPKDGIKVALDGAKKYGDIPGMDKVELDDVIYTRITELAQK